VTNVSLAKTVKAVLRARYLATLPDFLLSHPLPSPSSFQTPICKECSETCQKRFKTSVAKTVATVRPLPEADFDLIGQG
jgi:hypothetical protein